MAAIASMIASVSENGVIGRGGRRAWRNPAETERLLRLTRGRPLIVGRRTFAAMRFVPSHRWYLVLTRDPDLLRSAGTRDLAGYGYWFYRTLDEATETARLLSERAAAPEYFVAGGAEVFAQMLPRVRRFYRTEVHLRVDGDVFLPEPDLDGWKEIHSEHDDGRDGIVPAHTFTVFEQPMAGRA